MSNKTKEKPLKVATYKFVSGKIRRVCLFFISPPWKKKERQLRRLVQFIIPHKTTLHPSVHIKVVWGGNAAKKKKKKKAGAGRYGRSGAEANV